MNDEATARGKPQKQRPSATPTDHRPMPNPNLPTGQLLNA